MITTIDQAGRIVIPKALRERAGLLPGVPLRVELDGAGIRIEVEPGQGLETAGRFLVIPESGSPLVDETVDALRRDEQR
jgi:AbrB family looped-hinge helix DNA binding protein